MKYNVLLADDDASIRFVISKSLTRAGYNVRATDNAATLMKWVANGEGDVVLSDVHMDQEDIFNFIPELKKLRPELPIIIMSANTSVMTALKSGKHGVFDYLPKPFDLSVVEQTIARAVGSSSGPALKNPKHEQSMIGRSRAMQPVFRAIADYMSGDIPVYIYGDIGTGKNLAATVLHSEGKRGGKPFIHFDRYGNVAELVTDAAGGDIFVDRLHELDAERQALLLQALERNETAAEDQKFRLLVTGNEPLQARKNVRPDLLNHLGGGQIFLPPLSKRTGDVMGLSAHFLGLGPKALDKKFSPQALEVLKLHPWPGNVRELKNLTDMIALKYDGMEITKPILTDSLAAQIPAGKHKINAQTDFENLQQACQDLLQDAQKNPGNEAPYVQALAWVEKPLIEAALRITGGNNLRAAKLLGIHRNTLRTKIKALDIIS